MWHQINILLNDVGGLISLIGIVLSILITIKTGQIKRSVKNLLDHNQYMKQKSICREKLEGLLKSITEDNLFDNGIVGEISREVATLTHYEVYFDRKTKKKH